MAREQVHDRRVGALRGLNLRPIVHNHPPQFQRQFSPALHIHATLPAPAGDDDFGDEPDNVHPRQR